MSRPLLQGGGGQEDNGQPESDLLVTQFPMVTPEEVTSKDSQQLADFVKTFSLHHAGRQFHRYIKRDLKSVDVEPSTGRCVCVQEKGEAMPLYAVRTPDNICYCVNEDVYVPPKNAHVRPDQTTPLLCWEAPEPGFQFLVNPASELATSVEFARKIPFCSSAYALTA